MSFSYFSTLNYTLANEDTRLEVGILPEGLKHITSVCGSGGRVLPLLARGPKEVTLVDLSQSQLHLAELRFATLKSMGYSEFCAFWGYPPRSMESAERQRWFQKLDLSDAARTFLEKVFSESAWSSILYRGRWEKMIGQLASVNRKITRDAGAGLFGCLSLEDQERYLRDEFPRKSWMAVVALLGNAGVFNALIYKGHFPKKNIGQSFFNFYRTSLDRCMAQGLVRESFFLQLLFFGKIIFAEGVTAEVDPSVFDKAKTHVDKCKVNYICGNIIEVVSQSANRSAFLSLSDVPSYFSGETEKQFLQRIRPGLTDDAILVLRHYLHVPENCDRSGYRDITSEFSKLVAQEKVQLYNVEVLQRAK